MITPNFRGNNVEIFNEKEIPSYNIRKIDRFSSLGMRAAESLLFVGFLLIILNNLGLIAPGTYFGVFSWVTVVVFLIGLIINFIMIPHLYFSSFKNFKKENSYWDRETFLILPSFFFGTFFLYGSQLYASLIILIISIILIAIIHYRFLRLSWKFLLKSSNEAFLMQQEYFVSLKYLTAYYVMLLVLLVLFNPLQVLFSLVHVHA